MVKVQDPPSVFPTYRTFQRRFYFSNVIFTFFRTFSSFCQISLLVLLVMKFIIGRFTLFAFCLQSVFLGLILSKLRNRLFLFTFTAIFVSIARPLGFEPRNNSFGDYPLKPLEYGRICGRTGIRTLGTCYRPTVFKTVALNLTLPPFQKLVLRLAKNHTKKH